MPAVDKIRTQALWQRLAADNDFQSWLTAQQEAEQKRLMTATGEVVYRAQGRVQMLHELRQHLDDARRA